MSATEGSVLITMFTLCVSNSVCFVFVFGQSDSNYERFLPFGQYDAATHVAFRLLND